MGSRVRRRPWRGGQLDHAAPDFSGLALLTDRGLHLVGPDLDLSPVGWSTAPEYFASARQAVAFAALSPTGVQVARLKGDAVSGAWQRTQSGLPWDELEGDASGVSDEAMAARGPVVVGAFTADGNTLLLLRPADGAYAWYHAADGAADLEVTKACPGIADTKISDPVTYRALVLLEAENVAVLGDRSGRVIALPLAPTAACVALDDLAGVVLTASLPVTSLSAVGAGVVLATQAGGPAHLLPVQTAGLAVTTSQKFVCDFPLGGTASGLDGGGFAIACYDTQGQGVGSAAPDAPAAVTYVGVTVETVDAALELRGVSIPLPTENVASMAVGKGEIILLRDNALGLLEVTSLEDATTRRRSGIFVEGVLD